MIHQVVSEVWVFRMGSTILEHPVLRAYEGGFRGYIVPGPGRVEAVAFSLEQEFFSPCPICVSDLGYGKTKFEWRPFFCPSPNFGEKLDQIWVKTFFFCSSSTNCGEKFEWRPFFFCSSPNFGEKLGPNLSEDLFFFFCCSSPNFGGPELIFVPPAKISLWGPACTSVLI